MRSSRLLVAILMLSIGIAWAAAVDSRAGYYRVSVNPQIDPLVINRIHNWIVHVEDPDGGPVLGATISLTGGMPAHDHGLPTAPRMTRDLGDGDYLVEGIRFHMGGDWEVEILITSGERSDVAMILLSL